MGTHDQTACRNGGSPPATVMVTLPVHAFFGRRLTVVRQFRSRLRGVVVEVEHPEDRRLLIWLPIEWTELSTRNPSATCERGASRLRVEDLLQVLAVLNAINGRTLVALPASQERERLARAGDAVEESSNGFATMRRGHKGAREASGNACSSRRSLAACRERGGRR